METTYNTSIRIYDNDTEVIVQVNNDYGEVPEVPQPIARQIVNTTRQSRHALLLDY